MSQSAGTYCHASAVADILAGYHRIEMAAHRDDRSTEEHKLRQDGRAREEERGAVVDEPVARLHVGHREIDGPEIRAGWRHRVARRRRIRMPERQRPRHGVPQISHVARVGAGAERAGAGGARSSGQVELDLRTDDRGNRYGAP